MRDEAVFDILFVLKQFKSNLIDELSYDEISALLYLSCFIGIYNGSNYADWGYKFYLTDGELTSIQLTDCINYLLSSHLLHKPGVTSNYYRISEKGEVVLRSLSGFQRYKYRKDQIACVSDIVVTSSVTSVIKGIYSNPELSKSAERSGAKVVLEEVGQELLFKNLKSICRKVGLNRQDAYSSTWAWLTYNSSVILFEDGGRDV
ncbi:hypothetical protein ACU6DW_001788 [Vibrio fluvialis]|nr:hypothetical protein [Vibrio fluvialis]